MTAAWVGGILGLVLGFFGAFFGIYASIKNTETTKERAFIIKIAIATCIYASVFLFLILLVILGTLPNYYFWIIVSPQFFLLGPFIYWGNRRLEQYRSEESENPADV